MHERRAHCRCHTLRHWLKQCGGRVQIGLLHKAAAAALLVGQVDVGDRELVLSQTLLAPLLRGQAGRVGECGPARWNPSEWATRADMAGKLAGWRTSLRCMEFQRFLIALSVRPGNILTISDQRVP